MKLDKAIRSYRLYHRTHKIFRDVKALSAQEACDKVAWLIGNTWVRVLTPVVHDPISESGHRGGGWKNITPMEPERVKGGRK